MSTLLSFSSPELGGDLAGQLVQFINCRVFRDGTIKNDYLWVRDGVILDDEKIFFDEKTSADIQVDCQGLILSPGFIDIQINGGFGVDFSTVCESDKEYSKGVRAVASRLLQHGVTSFAPTIITSSPDVYHRVLPLLTRTKASADGAAILGAHVEGPFISSEKRGCHPQQLVRNSFGHHPKTAIKEVYGSTENIAIITLAPELEGAEEAIRHLVASNVVVSVGHSSAGLDHGEKAVAAGATTITHLFNAMQSYHHRDPGLIGLLTSSAIPKDEHIYYGIISDGIHTHDSALRIAHKTCNEGMILVTDAIGALGMADGVHKLGTQTIHVQGLKAILEGTNTTAGSVASMPLCIRHLVKAARCSLPDALVCATERPARLLGLSSSIGVFRVGSVADLVLIDDDVNVYATFCGGRRVFCSK